MSLRRNVPSEGLGTPRSRFVLASMCIWAAVIRVEGDLGRGSVLHGGRSRSEFQSKEVVIVVLSL